MTTVRPVITNAAENHQPMPAASIEAKLVILGSQGVGKTSLVSRFINPSAPLSNNIQSTVGASFVTKRITDPDTSTTVRLQIWDTAGQERFRSISRLYYRGANAGLLCYDVTDEKSWEEMKGWLREIKENCDDGDGGPIIHVVGTKSDIVAEDPSRREVAFERTIAYVAEQSGAIPSSAGSLLGPSQSSSPPMTVRAGNIQNPDSKRSSGFWNQDLGWDSCHEVNAKDGEGIEEVFRVLARKLVEQRNRREAAESAKYSHGFGFGNNPAGRGGGNGDDYIGGNHAANNAGSFRLGYGDKRRSWLGLPTVTRGLTELDPNGTPSFGTRDPEEARRRGKCC